LYKVVKGGDENKAEDLKPYLAEFDALCERTGACLWYVHHDTKGQAGDRDARDRGSGSSVLNRDFDACITLTDHVDGDDMLVMHALPRNYAPPQDVTIRWDNGAFFKTDHAPEAMTSQKQQSPYRDQVRAFARENPTASLRDVAKKIGCSVTVARKWWDKNED
jgi:RecA-family ATPase